ncbi:TaqI-like C-terminal specificity domain-containing protein [Thermodesulfobium sp. 4217-1]|uniref:Eco57I restriction-modification methylase domain-containing protein n=1 Tax=Thermodesulfobium sp. 4217-1 TaxID=3120013 RepID=UPI003221DB67
MKLNIDELINCFSDDLLRRLLEANSSFKPESEELFYEGYDKFQDLRYLGSIEFEDTNRLGLFSIKVNKELNERSGKKEQYKLGKQIQEEHRLDLAIFAFYDEQGSFRLSLIYKEYAGTKSATSSYKRFTFYVNKKLTNKTFKDQIGKCNFSSFGEIKSAFSVEPVTKAFYEEIQTWYFNALDKIHLPDDFKFSDNPEKDREIRNSTSLIRLITRVIFIWFLKEKSLVPEDLFSEDRIGNIIKDFKTSNNYYNAILQNLFFATLNSDESQRGFAEDKGYPMNVSNYGIKTLYRYLDKFLISKDEILEIFSTVPFLNGGLFDCLDKENENKKVIYLDGFSRNKDKQARIPDYLFFQPEEERIDISNYIQGGNKKSVRGLFDILKSYNFTIDENTPFDQEIALDPELLGKVFENLLAAYNPETSTTARKATGSYYTPREIVDYMVEESLFHHFLNILGQSDENTEKLRNLLSYSSEENPFNESDTKRLIEAIFDLKVLDPACGSGAFPMGILHRLTFILGKLDPDNEYWYELIYRKAVNESKEIFANEDKSEREIMLKELNDSFDKSFADPDYARKLYLIENCIYGVDIQPIAIQISKLRFFISLVIDQKVDKNRPNSGIKALPNLETKFIAANSLIGIDRPQNLLYIDDIEEIEGKIKQIKHKFFQAKTRNNKMNLQKRDKELRKRLSEMLNKVIPFEDSEKIANFDIFDQNSSAEWFDPEWMFGVRDGFDIVIGNPPYIQLQKNAGLLAKRYRNFNYKVFNSMGDIYALFYEKGIDLLKEDSHLCLITSNKWMRAGYGENLREFFTKLNPKILIDLGPGVFESATVDTNILLVQKKGNQKELIATTLQKEDKENILNAIKEKGVILDKLSKDAWFIGSSAEQKLKEKIERIGKPLKDWDVKIYRGILTGLNEAFIITTEKKDEILANCKTEEERKRTSEIIKPILRGRDIKRYYYEWAGLWLLWIYQGINIEKYPSILQHLLPFKKKLEVRTGGAKIAGDPSTVPYKWYELQVDSAAHISEFEKEKVVWQRITQEPTFCLVEPNVFILDSMAFFTGNKLKYVMALLNSKVIYEYVKMIVHQYGFTGFRLSNQYVEVMPLPPITPPNEALVKRIESLVDKILAAKKQTPQADTSEWEREIDEIVYKLYDLTNEEIRIIEGGR